MKKIAKFGLSVAALVFAATSAMAVTDTEFKYRTPKTGYVTINPMSFAPDGFSPDGTYTIFWGTGSLTAGSDSVSQCFNTHVNLPLGAQLVSLRTWTTSGDSGGVFVRLEALQLQTGSSTSLVSTTVGDTSGSRVVTNTPISSSAPAVNGLTAYGLGVCLDPGETFNGARIEFKGVNAGF